MTAKKPTARQIKRELELAASAVLAEMLETAKNSYTGADGGYHKHWIRLDPTQRRRYLRLKDAVAASKRT